MKEKPPRSSKPSANGGHKIPPPVSPKPNRIKNGSVGKKSVSKVTQAVAQLEKKDNGKPKENGKLEKRDSGRVVTPPVGGKKKPTPPSSGKSNRSRHSLPEQSTPKPEDVVVDIASLSTSVVSSRDCVVDIPEQTENDDPTKPAGNVPGTVLVPNDPADDATSLHDQDIQTDLQLLKRKLNKIKTPKGNIEAGVPYNKEEDAQTKNKDSVAINIEGDEAAIASPVGGRPLQSETDRPAIEISSPQSPELSSRGADPVSDVTDKTQTNNDSPQSNLQNNETVADKRALDIAVPTNKGSDKDSTGELLANTSTQPEETTAQVATAKGQPVLSSSEKDNEKLVSQESLKPQSAKPDDKPLSASTSSETPSPAASNKGSDNSIVSSKTTEASSIGVTTIEKPLSARSTRSTDRASSATSAKSPSVSASSEETKPHEKNKDGDKASKVTSEKQSVVSTKEEAKATEKDKKDDKGNKAPSEKQSVVAKEETKSSEKKDKKEDKGTKVIDKPSAKEETKPEKKDKKDDKGSKKAGKDEHKQMKSAKSGKSPKLPGKAKKAVPPPSVTEPAAEQDELAPLSTSAKSRWKILQARHHELLLSDSPRANGIRRDLSRTESLTVPGLDGRESPGRRDSYTPNSMRRGSGRSIDSKLSSIDLSKIAASMNDGGDKEKEVRKKNELTATSDNYLKNAIPYLPVPVAVLLLMLNMFLPGFGTMLSGLCVLCCGRPRVQTKDDHVLLTLCINLWVGLAQLFSVTFMLVGWVWSLSWGIYMVILSVEKQKEVKAHRQKELQAKALTALNSQIRPWTLRT